MELNKTALLEIAERTPTSEAFFNYARRRVRNVRNDTSPLRAVKAQMKKEGFEPVPQDLLNLFRELERAGVGKLQNGTFRWERPIKEIAEVVKSEPKLEVLKAIPPVTNTGSIPNATKTVVIVFGKNKEARVSFTPNLSPYEVEFVCARLLQECQG